MFTGFPEPTANWYRLPNTWFDDWRLIRTETGRTRIASLVKVTEYVIKHSWGYQNYHDPVRLSWTDFLDGRQRYGKRTDHGTGLSRGGLQRALDVSVDLDLLERPAAEEGKVYAYLPHMRPADAAVPSQAVGQPWTGFAPPQSNFFKVPKVWTDLTAAISSAVTILTVEYFMRHSWGWSGWDGEPRWLQIDEIAKGRRYRSPEREGERYDSGIGYSERSVSEAVKDAVERGLLVWRETPSGGREFALHLAGMQVDEEGRWLPEAVPDSKTGEMKCDPEMVPVSPAQSMPETFAEQITSDSLVMRLTAQVQRLTQTVQKLTLALKTAGIPLPTTAPVVDEEADSVLHEAGRRIGEGHEPTYEANRPPHEANRPPVEVNRPSAEATRPPICNKTPLEDTHCETPAADTGAGKTPTPGGAIPEQLCEALQQLHFRGAKSWAELRAAYVREPQRIGWWIRHLAQTRPGDEKAAGFLLQVVVRDGAPVPADAQSTSTCKVCGGSGFVFDGEQAVRCPACAVPQTVSDPT
jgi:hypothetical protein